MKTPKVALLVSALVCCVACSGAGEQVVIEKPPVEAPVEVKEVFKYPASRAEAVEEVLHGQSVRDPYRWLEDAKAPEVQEWMRAQDGFTRRYLEELPGRAALKARFEELYYLDSLSAPVHRGGRFFYTRRHADREKAIVYWKQGEQGQERVLLDPNTMGGEGGNVSLGRWVVSYDGRKVAYLLKENNADEATLYVMEVESGAVSEVDRITGAKYASPDWTPKGDGFYYTWLPTDEAIPTDERPGYAEIRYHKLGTDPAQDEVVQERLGDPTKFVAPSLSRDGRWLFRYVFRGWSETEIAVRDLKSKDKAFKPFYAPKAANASVAAWKDHFYIHTNEGASRYKVMRASVKRQAPKDWETIVPERPDVVIEGMEIVGGHLVLTLLKDVTSVIEVRKLDGALVREVPLPGLGSSSGMSGEPDQDDAYFSFASFTTPWQIYKTSVKGGETSLWSEVKVPVDSSPYVVDQRWTVSKDGTKVPMFLIHRKDLKRDGETPWLLYGYGGFDVSLKPYFRASIYPWLEAGGGYAVVNLRGGGEFGDAWHRDGMLEKKQNVFDDFIGAAQFLVDEKYTSAPKLAIYGGSNGGLLVGAAMTQRPALFGAVVCSVPLLDMVRYHQFGSGRTWIAEYGSSEDEGQFKALYGYSPYHRVKEGERYPATLFLSADNDDRVDPLHARKMAAALQAANTSEAPILLRIEAQAGHGGSDKVKEEVAESVDLYSFLMSRFGMSPAPR